MLSSIPAWRVVVATCVVASWAAVASAQSINTYAGGGPIGDGKKATEAVLSDPWSVAFDDGGNLYIADRYNYRVRRVDAATGRISTFAGGGTTGLGDGGPAVDAELNEPASIAFDREGNLYITEEAAFADRIRRVDAESGVITTVAGGGSDPADGIPATEALLDTIRGLAVDTEGNIYVSETNNHRVRRIDVETGLIMTIAGTGTAGQGGDGGPASSAELNNPWALEISSDHELFISEVEGNAIRRIDLTTGTISTIHVDEKPVFGFESRNGVLFFSTNGSVIKQLDLASGEVITVAGSGVRSFSGDGGPAIEASLNLPLGLASTGDQIVIADLRNNRIRAIDLETRTIDTVAGGGPVGDGGPAVAANLSFVTAAVQDPSGNLIIADRYRIRRVDGRSGIISTIAGDGVADSTGDGGPATSARMLEIVSLTTDASGNIYFGTIAWIVRRIDVETGVIDTVAGNKSFGYDGDGGPADQATMGSPYGLALDQEQNLYIADIWHSVIRRVSATDQTITTIAGTGVSGFSGDGGLAIEAELSRPRGLAIDREGNLFVADSFNNRVRRIDAATRVISTVAGTDADPGAGNGAPATEERLGRPIDVALDGSENLYIAELGRTVRRVDAETQIISAVSGTGEPIAKGDGGPAIEASLGLPRAIDVTEDGTVFVTDSRVGRVRVIYACTEIGGVELNSPADGDENLSTAPTLMWTGPDRAFRFDVLLAKEGDSLRVVASDLTTTSFTPQNLEAGATYRWQVRATGDPFCAPVSESDSVIRTFTVATSCSAPPRSSLTEPLPESVFSDPIQTLSWTASPGAATYDVHLGSSFPPPFLASTTETSFTTIPLVSGVTYYWSIVTHAACNPSLTSTSEIRSFRIAGTCDPAGEFELLAPENGATDVPTTTSIAWSPSDHASSYDVFLGTTNPPSIFLPGTTDTEIHVTGFEPARVYFWSVRANTSCDEGRSRMSPTRSFTTRGRCTRPTGTSFVLTPPGAVGAGQTYAIAWEASTGLDSGGTYVIERSLDPSFSSILDAQELTGTSATFIADTPGLHYHRVRPVSRCDPSLTGPSSISASVNVVKESSNVIFTVEPEAVVSPVGKNLEDLSTTFTLENIASEPVTVVIGRAEIGAPPFFQIVDPLGGDSVFVTLEPRVPKSFEVRFSGPSEDVEAAYQGLVVVNAVGSPVIPYAFVNLKIGNRGSAKPEFRLGGESVSYTFFPGLDGDDANRPPIEIGVHNPGVTPMELGAEVGPEVWLEPEPGWNDTAIPPGATRTVRLFTRRNRALNGSALPRYTWFTVRTKTGESKRLLVQDNGVSPLDQGRTAIRENEGSFIIPHVVSRSSRISQVRLTNLGGSAVQVRLFFTPEESDGFDGSVGNTLVVVPPHDVVTLTDPLVQVFGRARPAAGQIEVRARDSSLGLLSISSSLVRPDEPDSAIAGVSAVRSGYGARADASHQITGVFGTGGETSRLVLAETDGIARATVRLTLYDDNGIALGEITEHLERYGYRSIDDLVSAFGITGTPPTGRLRIDLEGDGAVVGLAVIEGEGYASVVPSEPTSEEVVASRARYALAHGTQEEITRTLVAPYVASGRVVEGGGDYATVMGFLAPTGTTAEFEVTFTDGAGNVYEKTVPAPSTAIVQFSNVLTQLFGIEGPTEGSITIEGDPRATVFARLRANGAPAGTIDLISTISELVTTRSSARPLFVDGVSQSTNPAVGTRWNLYVREVGGSNGTLTIRLYEAGNRTHPFAIKEFAIGANGRLALESIFAALELKTALREKDRTNVLLVLTPTSGNAQVTAVAVEVDNRTGNATPHSLQPGTGLSPSGATSSLVRVVDPPSTPARRRPVERPD